jgi:hypothetical protein
LHTVQTDKTSAGLRKPKAGAYEGSAQAGQLMDVGRAGHRTKCFASSTLPLVPVCAMAGRVGVPESRAAPYRTK